MTDRLAAEIWLSFIIITVIVFLIIEIGLIIWAHISGEKNIQDWTLSDTIRRWSTALPWLAPASIAGLIVLVWHLWG